MNLTTIIDLLTSRWTFPSLAQWTLIAPLGIGLGAAAGWLAGYCRVNRRWPVGYTRKVFHFAIFTLAAGIGWLGGFAAVQAFGASIGLVVGYAVLRGNQSEFYAAIARPSDAPYERFYIIVPFCMTALGGMLSNLFFGHFATIGYIAAGWGDAVGEPVGTRWGKHKYRVPALAGIEVYRSLEGSAAVFLASWTGCMFLLFTMFHISLFDGLIVSSGVAIVTTLVEAFTYHSMDNLTIQVAASGLGALVIHLWKLSV